MTEFEQVPPGVGADILPAQVPPPRRRTGRIVVAAAVALAATGALWTATTLRDSPPATLVIEDLRAASAAAKSQGTATFEMTQSMMMGEQSFAFTMSGHVDFDRQLGSIDLDLGDAGAALGITRLQMVSSVNTIWLRVPDSRVAANGGRPWVSATLTPGAMSSNDPSAFLDQLSSVSGPPERIGEESVRDVATTRYRSTMSADTIAAAVPEEMRAQVQSGLTAAGITSVPIEVWVDDGGLPRRVETKISVQGMDTVSRMEMFDYGKPVDISVPTAAETNAVSTLSALYTAAGLPPGILG